VAAVSQAPGEAPQQIALPEAFRPRTGTMESWNAAYVRVEDYLRAHRIHNRLHQSRLIQKILERAARSHEAHPALDPTTIAAEETEALMEAWFAEVLDEKGQPLDRLAVDGRVSLLLCDGPEHWPYAFLDEEHTPADFVQAMRTSHLNAGPDLAVSSMVPRPIDLGRITEAAGETLERFERWPILRALLLWMLFAAALAGIFYLTR
jgi:hypothetical protein